MSGDVDPTVLDECRRLARTWAPVLSALGNPERLLITLWLAGTISSVRDLEHVTGLSQSLVSYHLRALRDAGLVTATAHGRTNLYQLAHPDLDKLALLVETSTHEHSRPCRTNAIPAAGRRASKHSRSDCGDRSNPLSVVSGTARLPPVSTRSLNRELPC